MIDVLRRRLDDGTTYAADPRYVFKPPWKLAPDTPQEVRAKLEAEWEKRRLKQREYRIRVELFPGNGWRTTQDFWLTLPVGLDEVVWKLVDPGAAKLFAWRLGFLRLALKTLLLLMWPTRFAEQAAEHAFRTELLTNKQLRQARPDERMTYEDRTQRVAQFAAAAKALQQAIFGSLSLTILVALAVWSTVLVMKWRATIPFAATLAALRVISAGLIAWAVLGRLGWEIQTIKDHTIPEQVNRFWWRALYLVGVYLALVLIMLGTM